MKKQKLETYTPAQLRHAADIADRRAGRALADAADCGDEHPEERRNYLKAARKAARDAADFRAQAATAAADDLM